MINSKYLLGYHLLKDWLLLSVGKVVEQQQFTYIWVEM